MIRKLALVLAVALVMVSCGPTQGCADAQPVALLFKGGGHASAGGGHASGEGGHGEAAPSDSGGGDSGAASDDSASGGSGGASPAIYRAHGRSDNNCEDT